MRLYAGKIYAVSYGKWKHDMKPLIFVFYSDALITHTINLHYLSQPLLFQFISYVKKFQQRFPIFTNNLGKELYSIFRRYYPLIVKTSYRMYFTKFLQGYLINEGITQNIPSIIDKYLPEDLEKRDFMVRSINESLKKGSLFKKMPKANLTNNFFQPQIKTKEFKPFIAVSVGNNSEKETNTTEGGENGE